MSRTTNHESTYLDHTNLEEIIAQSGLNAKDIAAASGMSPATFARNLHGVSRTTSIGNIAQIANTMGYELLLTLHPRGEHTPEHGVPTIPLRVPLDATHPYALLHPLLCGPGQAFGPRGQIITMPSLLHAAVCEFLAPHEAPKVAAMPDPMRVFATRIRYQFKDSLVTSTRPSWDAILPAQYLWYLSQGAQSDDLHELLATTDNRPIVVLAPKTNHYAWHEVARCGVCREGGNIAGRVLEDVREYERTGTVRANGHE